MDNGLEKMTTGQKIRVFCRMMGEALERHHDSTKIFMRDAARAVAVFDDCACDGTDQCVAHTIGELSSDEMEKSINAIRGLSKKRSAIDIARATICRDEKGSN